MRVAVVEVLISAIANPTLPALPCASVPTVVYDATSR